MAQMYSAGVGVMLAGPVVPKGVTQRMAWEDGPNGRRPSTTAPELDEHQRPGFVVDADMPLGRDGAAEKVGVTVWSHEVPELTWVDFHGTPMALPVTFEGLRMYVRAARTGKGVEVTMSADAMRTVGAERPTGRRGSSQSESAEAA